MIICVDDKNIAISYKCCVINSSIICIVKRCSFTDTFIIIVQVSLNFNRSFESFILVYMYPFSTLSQLGNIGNQK